MANLSCLYKLIKCGKNFQDVVSNLLSILRRRVVGGPLPEMVRAAIGPVELIEIDIVRLQTSQVTFYCLDYLGAGNIPAFVYPGWAITCYFRSYKEFIPPAGLFYPLTEDFLSATLGFGGERGGRVHLGGIDEIHTALERTVDLCKGLVRRVLGTPRHAAKTNFADAGVGIAELSQFHGNCDVKRNFIVAQWSALFSTNPLLTWYAAKALYFLLSGIRSDAASKIGWNRSMQLPTVKQMQYLVAVNESLHFGKAAESCFVTQSALSTGIRELENMLGVKLFERSRKQISTTTVGETLSDQAQICLAEIAKLVELADSNNKPLSGPVRLGIIPTITPFMLPTMLPALRTEFENIDFYLSEDLTDHLYEKLMAGDLDICLLALPFKLPGTEIVSLFQDPLMLAYHEKTELIDPESWTPGDQSWDNLMLLENGHCLRDHAVEQMMGRQRQGVHPFDASSLSTLIHMIGSDLGFSLLPQMALDSPVVKNSGIRLRSIDADSDREIALVWRDSAVRGEDFRAIAEFLSATHVQPSLDS